MGVYPWVTGRGWRDRDESCAIITMDGELPRWESPPRVHPQPRMCIKTVIKTQSWQLCGRSRVVANMGVAHASAGSRGGVGGPHRSIERASAHVHGAGVRVKSSGRPARPPLLLGWEILFGGTSGVSPKGGKSCHGLTFVGAKFGAI